MVIKNDKKKAGGFKAFCAGVEPLEKDMSPPLTWQVEVRGWPIFFLRDRIEATSIEESWTKVLSQDGQQPFNRKYQPVFLSLIGQLMVVSQLWTQKENTKVFVLFFYINLRILQHIPEWPWVHLSLLATYTNAYTTAGVNSEFSFKTDVNKWGILHYSDHQNWSLTTRYSFVSYSKQK